MIFNIIKLLISFPMHNTRRPSMVLLYNNILPYIWSTPSATFYCVYKCIRFSRFQIFCYLLQFGSTIESFKSHQNSVHLSGFAFSV